MKKLVTYLVLAWLSPNAIAQNVLTADEAVAQAVDNNFQVRIARNSSDIAANNTSIFNTGQLPIISLTGGANLNIDNTVANFQDGRSTTISGAYSDGANARASVSYVIYNGNARNLNIDNLQLQYKLSELEVQAAIENVIAQTLVSYYDVAEARSNLDILEAQLNVSKERLARAEEQYGFGQVSRLTVLNAEVDLNADSLSLINARLILGNTKRQLLNLINSDSIMEFEVLPGDTIDRLLSRQEIKNRTLDTNTSLLQSDKNIQLGHVNIELAKARRLPSLETNISYGYAYNNNNAASFLSSLNTHGLTGGVTLRYDLFDGGSSKTAIENAELQLKGRLLEKEQIRTDLDFRFETAWANYQNAMTIYSTELRNLEITQLNFDRSKEQFEVGQISSVDFRQAQINLLNARTRLNNALYSIKRSEIQLLLLGGMLLE